MVVGAGGAAARLEERHGIPLEGIGGCPFVGVNQVHAARPGEHWPARQRQKGVSPPLEAPELMMLRSEPPGELVFRLHVLLQEQPEDEIVHIDWPVLLRIVESVAVLPGQRALFHRHGKAVEFPGEQEAFTGLVSEDVVPAGSLVLHDTQIRLLPPHAVARDCETEIPGRIGRDRGSHPDLPQPLILGQRTGLVGRAELPGFPVVREGFDGR